MSPADAESYRRQFAAAVKRLPRGHVIHHAEWRDGQLRVQHHKPERQAQPPAEAPRVRRGAMQGTLL